MDETTLLVIVSLVGPVIGAVVGAILGYYLGNKSLRAELASLRVRIDRSARQDAQETNRQERVETATILLTEIGGITRKLRDGYHQFITSNSYWNPIPTIPTSAYSQLISQGRIIKLGTELSPLVDALYGEIAKMNRGIEVVNRKVSEHRTLVINDPQRYLGDDWFPVVNAKDQFLRQVQVIEEALQRIR